MKKILYIIGILMFTIPFMTSCERDITTLNVDPKHPDTLPSEVFFSTAQYNLFDRMNGANVNQNISRFFTQQWTETTYTDESNYDMVTRQINTNHWNHMYRNVLNAIKLGKEKLDVEALNSGDPSYNPVSKNNRWAQLEIMEIYTWANLVDTYNNIPYTDALKLLPGGEGSLSPKYDDAKTIYGDLIRRLTEVNSKITAGENAYSDYSYNGDMSKWKKLANSIKLRLGVNLYDVDAALSKTTVESAFSSGVFTSNDDNFLINYTSGNFASPLYKNVNVAGSGRKDFVAANTYVDFMNDNNDPRRSAYFTQVEGAYVGGTYGASSAFDNFSHVADDIIKENGVGDLMDYSEVSFLLAEAAQRGFSVGGTPEMYYTQAIKASMDYWKVPADEAAAYIAAHPYDAANWKKSLGEQSWMAMYNRGYEAWTFNRRLDFPVFEVPEDSVLDSMPTRMAYPAPEQSLNQANWQQAVSALPGGEDVPTTKVFWDVN